MVVIHMEKNYLIDVYMEFLILLVTTKKEIMEMNGHNQYGFQTEVLHLDT